MTADKPSAAACLTMVAEHAGAGRDTGQPAFVHQADHAAPVAAVVTADNVTGVEDDGGQAIGRRLFDDGLGGQLGPVIKDGRGIAPLRRVLGQWRVARPVAPGIPARGEDEFPGALALRCRDDIARAVDIGAELARTVPRPHGKIGRHVEHGIHAFRDRGCQAGQIEQAAFDAGDIPLPDRLEPRRVAIGGRDLPAPFRQLLDQVAAEKACGAGDEGMFGG